MRGEYRCGLAVSCKDVRGVLGVEAAGITEHPPFVHPQLPAPQSSGPSQFWVHIRLHTVIDAGLTQLVG